MGSIDLALNMSGFFGLSALVIASLSYKLILTVWPLSVVTSQCVHCYVWRMRSFQVLVWFHWLAELQMQTTQTLYCGRDRGC